MRVSTLPVQGIADFIGLSNVQVSPFVNFMGNGGGFLSEFVAYHGVWYQGIHSDPMLPDWSVAAGHVHVGGINNLLTAKRATKATLRRLIHYVDGILDAQTGQAEFFCSAEINSSNTGAQLTMTGSVSLARNDLKLIVNHAIESNFGLLFYGPSQQPRVTFGQGSLCVSGSLQRVLPARAAGMGGFLSMPIDLQSAPFKAGSGAITSGSKLVLPVLVPRPGGRRCGLQRKRRPRADLPTLVPCAKLRVICSAPFDLSQRRDNSK